MQTKIKNNFMWRLKNKKFFNLFLTKISNLGKALLFPIAVLPIAGILNRIGSQIPQENATEWALFVGSLFRTIGQAVFDNLYIIFGVGIAFGLTKDNRGEAALVGLLSIICLSLLMSSKGANLPEQIYKNIHFPIPSQQQIDSGIFTGQEIGFARIFGNKYDLIMSQNVLNGIVCGSLTAFIYNKFNNIKLPNILSFFSGRRLVPVLGILSIILFSILYSILFPWCGYVLYLISKNMINVTGNQFSNAAIAGLYCFMNRILIPFGLHHIPNTLFWFTFGEFDAQLSSLNEYDLVYGDIQGFLFGDVIQKDGSILTAGTFQTGFFPIMMFGLPAICYAFYATADNAYEKKKIISIFLPAAFVCFLTGITEPIEFAFMFVSPLLYLTYAFLSGLFGFIINLFGIQIGFSFSAGFLDYLLSLPKSLEIANAKFSLNNINGIFANPLWLFFIGTIAFITYFFVAKFLIIKLNLNTPGRQKNNDIIEKEKIENQQNFSLKAQLIVKGLGGWDNILSYQNCATRLRYEIKNHLLIDHDAIKKSNVLGFNKISNNLVQIIVGTNVESLNDEIIRNKNKPLEV